MKRVLISGAGGFLGRNALEGFLDRGFEVHGLTLSPPAHPHLRVQWHQADLLDLSQIPSLMKAISPSHLLHLAWDATPNVYWASPKNFSWVIASLELLRCFIENGGERAVGCGSSAEYDWRHGFCSETITPTLPKTVYGVCKASLQRMWEAYGKQSGISTAWARPFSLYGPYEKPSRLIPTTIRALLNNESPVCLNGREVIQFMHVEDAGNALAALTASTVDGPVNIASETVVTLGEVLYQLAVLVDRRDLIYLGGAPASENHPPVLLADVRRLSEEVKWKEKHSLPSGLATTFAWWKENLSHLSNQNRQPAREPARRN